MDPLKQALSMALKKNINTLETGLFSKAEELLAVPFKMFLR
jgi:hypothetical protein